MTRRELLACGAALLCAPLRGFAQSDARIWRIGVLSPRSGTGLSNDPLRGFLQGMRDRGYVEGRNVQYEWRFADGNYASLPGLASELVRLNMDVILVAGNPAAQAAKKATRSIPIVIGSMSAPVETGLVASLARPGGNITGVSTIGADLAPKQFELLATTLPRVSRMAVLVNPANATRTVQVEKLDVAAKRRNVTLETFGAATPEEIRSAFARMVERHVQALVVVNDSFLIQQTRAIAREALAARVPAIFSPQDFAVAGGLMSYGVDLATNYRRAASYVDRILKGANPGELPVEEPSEFVLAINLNTAHDLGINVPQSLLISATRLIGR